MSNITNKELMAVMMEIKEELKGVKTEQSAQRAEIDALKKAVSTPASSTKKGKATSTTTTTKGKKTSKKSSEEKPEKKEPKALDITGKIFNCGRDCTDWGLYLGCRRNWCSSRVLGRSVQYRREETKKALREAGTWTEGSEAAKKWADAAKEFEVTYNYIKKADR